MKRRDLVALCGLATTAGAMQRAFAQPVALPVIGFLGSTAAAPELLPPFVAGLAEGGFRIGRNVALEVRWADNDAQRLPALVAELLRLPAAVLVTVGGLVAARAAKAATSRVPVVFEVGADPVAGGLVDSLARPGANLTGVHMLTGDLNAKRLGLLHEMVPRAATIAALINPANARTGAIEAEVRTAAAALGIVPWIVHASTEREFDAAFASAVGQRAGAIVVCNDAYFNSRRAVLVALARRHGLPAIYEWREFAALGGLMSYGTDLAGVLRQLGGYTARVLKGVKPADLPVLQPTGFKLVINRKTAQALGLTVPSALLLRADEVIE